MCLDHRVVSPFSFPRCCVRVACGIFMCLHFISLSSCPHDPCDGDSDGALSCVHRSMNLNCLVGVDSMRRHRHRHRHVCTAAFHFTHDSNQSAHDQVSRIRCVGVGPQQWELREYAGTVEGGRVKGYRGVGNVNPTHGLHHCTALHCTVLYSTRL